MRRKPRDYQVACKDAVRDAFKRGVKGIVAELFTGAGKGFIIADIAKDVMARKGRVLITVNRDNLCDQLMSSVHEQGLYPVLERGIDKASPLSDCVVGSIQSMQGNRLAKWRSDHFSLVITDEIHFGAADTFVRVLNHFQDAYHLGLSATIERHDKKGLWHGYKECVFSMPLTQGIEQGWLVPFEFEDLPVPIVIDDKTAKKKMWTEADESGVFDKDEYLPRLFREAAARSYDKKGLFFWPNCKSSEEAAKAFCVNGIEAKHVDGYMPKTEIEEILSWFKTSGPKALMNADLLSYGYDNPTIDLVGVMRLSRSIPTLKQRLGRGTRPVAAVDNYDTAEERKQAIANSFKPKCKVLDLMLQLGDVQNTFATPSALITSDDYERRWIEQEMRKGKFTIAELDEKIRAHRSEMNSDEALAKLAEDAANAALRKSVKPDGPYVGDIFMRFPRKDRDADATEKQVGYLKRLGCNMDLSSVTKLQAIQLINRYLKHLGKAKA